MFPTNAYMFLVAALIPMVVGFVYYGPLFGKAWMNVNGFTEESLKKGNMAVIFGVSFLLSVFLGLFLSQYCIHQNMIPGLFVPELMENPESQMITDMKAFLANYGDRHRTFNHGAVHGAFAAFLTALPLIGINALFERRGWKYIGIHFGYWLITMILMGGVLCATLDFPPL